MLKAKFYSKKKLLGTLELRGCCAKIEETVPIDLYIENFGWNILLDFVPLRNDQMVWHDWSEEDSAFALISKFLRGPVE